MVPSPVELRPLPAVAIPTAVDDGADLVLVADQVAELGGSERVLQAVVDRYPAARVLAPRFTTTNLPPGVAAVRAERVRLAGQGRPRRHFLAPVFARRIARAPVGAAAVVVSLTHNGWSAAARVPPGARQLCYCAGLPRWLYGDASAYLGDYPLPLRPALRAAIPALRVHNRRLLRRPNRLLTNSSWSARAIASVYGRRAEVIHPPVRTSFFTPAPRPRRGLLAVGRLVRHKRFELLVEAARHLDDELVVAGGGALLPELRRRAPSNVRFAGFVDDEELLELYRGSRAFVCPSVEEFGIVMAEAQACGVPVIAPRAGGALDVVRDGETGILVDRLDGRSLAEAVRALDSRPPDQAACRASAERFAEERFVAQLERVIDEERAAASVSAPVR
jgi:glycosyltransferase involved in cell wall biosynthesis